MASVKPALDRAAILDLLQETFAEPIRELAPVQGGVVAQTLSFVVGDEEYILRFVTDSIDVSYQKEAFIYHHFASPSIPIPPILQVGHKGETYYAISKKLPGRGLESLSQAEYEQALPDIIETLYAIHLVDVSEWHGYGWLDDHGTGMFASWKEFLARIIEEERPDGFYGKWHRMFEDTFLERDFCDAVYAHMLRLLDVCPEERHLVHGGYGWNNVLVQDGEVTAVLDWVDTSYGDFVYDIAWIDFWSRGINHAGRFHQYYAEHGLPLEHYEHRIACYKCYMGLDAMRFYAKTGDREAYQATRRILQNLLTVAN